MADKTSFLELRKQAHNDNVGKWHVIERANWQILDDEFNALAGALITTPSPQSYDNLKGSMDSLEARLDVSINDDGTVDHDGIDYEVLDESNLSSVNTLEERLLEHDAFHIKEEVSYSGSINSVTHSWKESMDSNYFSNYDACNIDQKYYGSGSALASLSLSVGSGVDDYDLTFSYGSSLPCIIQGQQYKLTRNSTDFDLTGLSSGATSGSDDARLWFVSLIGKSKTDFEAFFTAYSTAQSEFYDAQLTRSGTGSGSCSKGGNTFTATDIGSADVGLNDWKPSAGELILVDSVPYKIKSIDSDNQISIYGEFHITNSAADWSVYDYTQPNIFVYLGSTTTSPNVLMNDEHGSMFDYSCFLTPSLGYYGYSDSVAIGPSGAPVGGYFVQNYAQHIQYALTTAYSKTSSLKLECLTALAHSTSSYSITGPAYGTKIRSIQVWVRVSSSSSASRQWVLLDPMIYNGTDYLPAFYIYTDGSSIELDMQKDTASSTGTAFSSPSGVSYDYSDVEDWGVFLTYELP